MQGDTEETKGAFTVVNKNNTDNDKDSAGNDISDLSDDIVKAGSIGENEQDLVKLKIMPPNDPTPGTSKMTIELSAGVKLYKDEFKDNEVDWDKDDSGNYTFLPGSIPAGGLTVWIEVTTESTKLADKSVTLRYKGTSDVVKITGIWAKMTEMLHNNGDKLWDGFKDSAPGKEVTALGGVGLQPDKSDDDSRPGYANVMAQKWSLGPAGIGAQSIFYDVTRQAAVVAWGKKNGQWELIPDPELDVSFPQYNERPNDDKGNSDEYLDRTKDAIYSYDKPAYFPLANTQYDEIVYRASFKEFVRVNFRSAMDGPNVLSGSRASDVFEWHSTIRMSLVNGKWVRSPTENSQDENVWNEIAPGGIKIERKPSPESL